MPIYDWVCDECGAEDDVFAPIAHMEDPIMCDTCGSSMRRKPSAAVPSGILPTKPLVIEHAAKTLTTNEEARAYEKELEDTGFRMISASSSDWDKHVTHARNLAEKRAKQRGFRDWEHSKAERGRELAKKRKMDREQSK